MATAWIVCVFVSVAFGVLRFTLPIAAGGLKINVYKALAHVWVGTLFGAGLFYPEFLGLAVGLTVLEVIAFVIGKVK